MALPNLLFYPQFLPNSGSTSCERSKAPNRSVRFGTEYGSLAGSLYFYEFLMTEWLNFLSCLTLILSLFVLDSPLWTIRFYDISLCQLTSLHSHYTFWPIVVLVDLPQAYGIAMLVVVPFTWSVPLLKRAPLLASTSADAFIFRRTWNSWNDLSLPRSSWTFSSMCWSFICLATFRRINACIMSMEFPTITMSWTFWLIDWVIPCQSANASSLLFASIPKPQA